MKLRMIDPVTGLYLRDAEVGEMTEAEARALDPALILDPIPEGMISPRWEGEQWVESETEEYPTDETPQLPTLEERISALEQLEIERIMGGVG